MPMPSTLPEAPLVSLLMPNFNRASVLDLVLERLAEHTTYSRVEVIAVDDGSTDASREILRRWRDSGRFPAFELIEKPNSGAVDSLNVALDRARGEVCVQLDSDASVETHGWVERMLALLCADDRVGAVAAKIVMDDGMIHACGVDLIGPEGHRDRTTIIDEPLGKRTYLYRVTRVPEGSDPLEDRLAEVDAGVGCCLMYRREDALAAGGYDPGYSPVWFDDLDLCLGIRRLGRKVFYLPDVRVVHHVTGRLVARPPATLREHAKEAGKRIVPAGVRRSLRKRLTPGAAYSDEQRARMRSHYSYWQGKWGWHMLNPGMREIERRWGGTEICWRTAPERRAAGEQIIRAHLAAVGAGDGEPPRPGT